PSAQTGTPATAQAEQAIDFSPLRKFDLTGSIRMGELTASNIKVQNLRVDVSAKNGVLRLNPMMANLYQGTLRGSASLDANTNHIATKQNLAGISIGPLLRDAIGKDLMEGHGNVAFDLTSSGNLVTAMKKSLN